MQLFAFDESYLQRLRDRDVPTEKHFVDYFSTLLQIKLRSRLRSWQAVEDVKQETFVRVLAALRSEGGIRHAERLGAFVNSVCNNILLEVYRSYARDGKTDATMPETPDRTIDLEGLLTTQETQRLVRTVLDRLSEKDRRLLRALFIEETNKDELCREFGVDRDYLRVLLHRAKQSFKAAYQGGAGGKPGKITTQN